MEKDKYYQTAAQKRRSGNSMMWGLGIGLLTTALIASGQPWLAPFFLASTLIATEVVDLLKGKEKPEPRWSMDGIWHGPEKPPVIPSVQPAATVVLPHADLQAVIDDANFASVNKQSALFNKTVIQKATNSGIPSLNGAATLIPGC